MAFSSFWFGSSVVNPISLSATASVGDVGGSNVGRINDGDLTTLFTTASAPTDGQGICKLDFGSAQTIAGFKAYLTQQAAGDAITMRLEHSADDSSWTTFGTAWTISPGNSGHTETQTPSAVSKRYWRLTANQNYDAAASTSELELYATTGQMP
jgi:hypothetical protein|tara:strand:- start:1289 stop:1750 length:462 start_codon:yes stop_codon:yes gene_type:complete